MIFKSLEQLQELRVFFQLETEKITAEVGYYEPLSGMLIISGLQSESIWPCVDSYITQIHLSSRDPLFTVLTKL